VPDTALLADAVGWREPHDVTHLDHLTIFVSDHAASALWYTRNLDFEVEFETPDGQTTAIRDDQDFTIFLTNRPVGGGEPRCVLYFEVDDVDREFGRLKLSGVDVLHVPQDNPWGYGPELHDPDGHSVRLWDKRSATDA